MKKTFKKLLLIIGSLLVIKTVNAQTQKGADINGETTGSLFGNSVSMPDANTLAIGAPSYSGKGVLAGHVRVFKWNGNAWIQKGADIDGEAIYDASGHAVSMPDANTLAIAAENNNGNGAVSGHVRIFTWNGSAWVQKGNDIDGEAGDKLGSSVCMSDPNTIGIGAAGSAKNGLYAGGARVYNWNGSAWIQKGNNIEGEASFDGSGESISMPDSNTVAIGAANNAGNGLRNGHVRVYSWNSGAWTQKGSDINGEDSFDFSGNSVSMPDPNTVAIGAHHNSGKGIDAGHVRIFTWNGSTWIQKGNDIDSEWAYDMAGYSVSMPNANTIAIGATLSDGKGKDAGHVRIFVWDGNSWIQRGTDIDGESSLDQSGYSLCMPDSNTVAIGAIRNDDNGTDAGHVRVYSLAADNTTVFENDFEKIIVIYPNPTSDNLSIDLGACYDKTSVMVTNAIGQEIIKKYFNDSQILQLNIPGQACMYFIEVQSGDKKAIVKVIKQ